MWHRHSQGRRASANGKCTETSAVVGNRFVTLLLLKSDDSSLGIVKSLQTSCRHSIAVARQKKGISVYNLIVNTTAK